MRAARLVTLAVAMFASIVTSAWAAPSFVVTETLAVPRSPTDVAVGDLNNDNIDDLAIVSRSTRKVSLVLVQEDGTFRQGASIVIGNRLKSIAIGDFNNDGNGDVIVATGSRNVFVVTGRGDGTFDRQVGVRRCCGSGGVIAVDIDNSRPGAKFGDDLVFADPGKDDVNVLINKNQPGGVGFNVPGTRIKAGNRPEIVVSADFNDDDKPDLAALNTAGSGNDASSIVNIGAGSFSNLGNFFAGKRARDLRLTDYNKDMIPDLVTVDRRPSTIHLQPGLGGGLFGTGPILPVPCAADVVVPNPNCTLRQVAVADFDGDTNVDLATLISGPTSVSTTTQGGETNSVLVYTGDVAGNFFGPTRFPNMGLTSKIIKVGNFNRDNKPDLVVASTRDSRIRLLLNTTGAITPATVTSTPGGAAPTPTPSGGVTSPTPCRGQGCDCNPENGDDDCNNPLFCAEEDEVCCDTPCDVDNASCSLQGAEGICKPTDLDDGEECMVDEQCLSGFCVDGFCCNEACDGPTQRCDNPPGQCTDSGTVRPTATFTPTPPGGGNATPTSTRRLKELGEDCGAGSECRSTFCPSEDLVCCDDACNGADEQCDLPTQKGHCLPINLPDGDDCIVDQQCLSQQCENGKCGSGGTRTPSPPVTPKPNGGQCTADNQCVSGHCADDDGVCCNTECDGASERCDLDPLVGTCLPIDLPNGSPCQHEQQCLSHVCQGNVCQGNATPAFTPTRTPNTRVPTSTRTATPPREPTLILARGSGCSTGDNTSSGSAALLLIPPAWWFISSRVAAPARRRRRRR